MQACGDAWRAQQAHGVGTQEWGAAAAAKPLQLVVDHSRIQSLKQLLPDGGGGGGGGGGARGGGGRWRARAAASKGAASAG